MIFKETITGKTYKQIPEAVLEKNKETLHSLKAVYVYAKILMLRDKNYSREIWVTNPISKQKEMSIDTMSDVTGKLEMANLIRINKFKRENDWPMNSYEIVAQPGEWKPVYCDFINHTGLSADAKGLAILLSLLKYIPKRANAIGKEIGISGKTVKKYMSELLEAGIINPETRLLNEDCFPYWKLVRESDKHYRVAMHAYEEDKIRIQKTDKKLLSAYTFRFWKWLNHLQEPEEVKARIWFSGFYLKAYKRTKAEKQQIEDERKAIEDAIKQIKL